MGKNIEDLFRLAQRYKPQQVGVEVTGQQGGFISWIQDEMIKRSVYFSLASEGNSNKPGIRPNTNKMERFMIVQPWFTLGRMFFPNEMRESEPMKEFIDEIGLACKGGFKSKHDDFLDTISMLASMSPWKPSEEVEQHRNEGEDMWEMETDDNETSGLDSYTV